MREDLDKALGDQIVEQIRGPIQQTLLPHALEAIQGASDEIGRFVQIYSDQLASAIASGRPELVQRVRDRQGAIAQIYDLEVNAARHEILSVATDVAVSLVVRILSTLLGGPVAAKLSPLKV